MIFKRAVETTYKLKFESSRKLLSVVENNFFTFPWAFNVFDNVEENIVMKTDVSNLKAVARQGIVECVQHELMHPYPVMTERKNEFVAQFKPRLFKIETQYQKAVFTWPQTLRVPAESWDS